MIIFTSKREETCFKTITEAYRHYLLRYADDDEFSYYFNCCNTSLYEVKDERIMEEIFRNVFGKAVIIERN